MPTARQPLIFATCPTTLPTAPDAADTTTVSPAFGSPILSRPYQAVTPGIPITPSAVDIGAPVVLTFRKPAPGTTAYNCQPSRPVTTSPLEKRGSRDSMTSPTPP